MQLQIGGRAYEGEVEEADQLISPFSGRTLERVSVMLQPLPADEINALAHALEKGDNITATGRRWKVERRSEQYGNIDGLHSWLLTLEEVEELKAERLRVADLELIPERYHEEITSDALTITAEVSVTDEQAARIRDLTRSREYCEVIRDGVSTEPRRMRFGLNLWSDKPSLRFQLCLVEQSFDEAEHAPPLPLNEHARGELAMHASTLDALLGLMVAKGAISSAELSELRQQAKEAAPEYEERFTKVDDLDKYWDESW